MALVTNPSAARKLAYALASGRRQVGSNGDGNQSGINANEGVGEEAHPPMEPTTNTPVQGHTTNKFASGTRVAGYSPADQGPFRCDHCKHFDPKGNLCDGPNVMKDPQVEKAADGRAMVEAGGCCSSDYIPSGTTAPGFRAISRPGALGGNAPGSTPPGFGSNAPLQAPATGGNAPGSVS